MKFYWCRRSIDGPVGPARNGCPWAVTLAAYRDAWSDPSNCKRSFKHTLKLESFTTRADLNYLSEPRRLRRRTVQKISQHKAKKPTTMRLQENQPSSP